MNRDIRKLAASLFPLDGVSDSIYRFRVLKLRERIPDDNFRPIRMQKWADRLWRYILKCPVYPTFKYGYPAFLIPEENMPSNPIELREVPDYTYHIDISDKIVEVRIEDATDVERELICRMLERAFTDKLCSLEKVFWRAEWTLFYLQKPENENITSDIVNAYRGYKFGVVLIGDKPYLAVDARTRYIGRDSLAEYPKEDREKILQDHLDLQLPVKDWASFIRDNGIVKIPCRYAGETGSTIKDCKIKETGETVFQYYHRKYPNLALIPEDKAVFVQDRTGEDRSIPVPESRLFLVFTTEYEGVKRCSIKPQMTPQDRINIIGEFLNYITDIKYGDITIRIGKEPLIKERRIFVPPHLEFGNGEILEPFHRGIPDKASGKFDSGVARFGSKKIALLYNASPYFNKPLPSIVLLYPDTIDRAIRETFIEDVKREIRLQTGQTINIAHQRSYPTGRDERMGTSLLRVVTEVKRSHPDSLVVVILWDRFHKSVHGELKEMISSTFSQCVTEKTVRQICNKYNPQRARSQLRNLVLGILTEAGIKPWVLADPLHYDLYIGIDTLYGRICYHFLYGTGGRLIKTEVGHAIARGRMQEAIKKPELQRRLIDGIRNIIDESFQIKSIVLHRDGRWWPSESRGVTAALDCLKSYNILPSDVKCAVVEIRKTHKPIRLFTKTSLPPYFQNPLPGTYLVLDPNSVILTTTGRPGEWDVPDGRTARTILLKVVEIISGDFDIVKIAEDAYRLTHLNWSAPDIEINLPVTIRWTDEALRETFRPPVEEEEEVTEEYGSEEETEYLGESE
ncbi:hypothetical protein M1O52_03960 [Dehalococcoidia bacterium]|nr:hypothetical protein [Dehalococcoidia bacterium]